MTNALAVLNSSTELTELELMIQEEAALDEQAFDFVAGRIKMPSGGAAFFDVAGEPMKTFTAIAVVSQKARAWWPGEGTGAPPLCSSSDGLMGTLSPEPQDGQLADADTFPTQHPKLADGEIDTSPTICASCPLAQYGSAAKGRGQACKSLVRMVVLIDGYTMPLLMTLPPTSIKPWNVYASGLAQRKSAYFAVKTKFGLETKTNGGGIDYAVVTFSGESEISDKDTLAAVLDVRRQFADQIKDMGIDAEEYETVPTANDAEQEPPPF